MIKALTATVLAAAILSGCSGLPAQNLDLHPKVTSAQKLPADTVVLVKGVDTRKSALVGKRVDRLKNTAPLSLIDAQEQLEHAVEHALEDMGVTQFQQGEFTLTVYLDELSYDATMKNLLQEVQARTTLRLKVEKGGEFYMGKYQTQTTKPFVNTPTPQDNEELFNELVGETLTRAFKDRKLMDFLLFK